VWLWRTQELEFVHWTKSTGGAAEASSDASALVGPESVPVSLPHELPASPAVPGSGSDALDAFYRDLLHELGEFARRPSATAIGAAVVVKRVARVHGIEVAERLPLPRFNRAEREERAENEWRNQG
jgi:hypothetical protein